MDRTTNPESASHYRICADVEDVVFEADLWGRPAGERAAFDTSTSRLSFELAVNGEPFAHITIRSGARGFRDCSATLANAMTPERTTNFRTVAMNELRPRYVSSSTPRADRLSFTFIEPIEGDPYFKTDVEAAIVVASKLLKAEALCMSSAERAEHAATRAIRTRVSGQY